MQLPHDVASSLSILLQNKQFRENISYYTKIAFQSILFPSVSQQHQQQPSMCPSGYLLALSFYISNNVPLQSFVSLLPEQIKQQYLKSIRILEKKYNNSLVDDMENVVRVQNDHQCNLVDVSYEALIQNGREVWIVKLHTDSINNNNSHHQNIVMKLNYQQLSLFSYKVNQLVSHVKNIDINAII